MYVNGHCTAIEIHDGYLDRAELVLLSMWTQPYSAQQGVYNFGVHEMFYSLSDLNCFFCIIQPRKSTILTNFFIPVLRCCESQDSGFILGFVILGLQTLLWSRVDKCMCVMFTFRHRGLIVLLRLKTCPLLLSTSINVSQTHQSWQLVSRWAGTAGFILFKTYKSNNNTCNHTGWLLPPSFLCTCSIGS